MPWLGTPAGPTCGRPGSGALLRHAAAAAAWHQPCQQLCHCALQMRRVSTPLPAGGEDHKTGSLYPYDPYDRLTHYARSRWTEAGEVVRTWNGQVCGRGAG